VGVADGLGAAEVPDASGEVDVVPGVSGEVELWVAVVGVVVRRGEGVGVAAGVVTTPTMVGAGFGAGRTSRYVVRVSRNTTLSSTVDIRT